MGRKYIVTWTIDSEADNPTDAALDARHAQMPGTSALIFSVLDVETMKEVLIDLDEMVSEGDVAWDKNGDWDE